MKMGLKPENVPQLTLLTEFPQRMWPLLWVGRSAAAIG